MRALYLLPLLCFFIGCNTSDKPIPDAARSMYYWRTTLQLDSVECAFLRNHHIKKIYLRLFDVIEQNGKPIPSATLTFPDNSNLPAGVHIVPVIFITENCLRTDTAGLAEHLVSRVQKMCETHQLPTANELQIDCDWTPNSREAYFSLLHNIATILHAQGVCLSVTIRLHQLSQPVPPADFGVLMLYNSGDFRQRHCPNPIFHTPDIEPYLKNLRSYSLPLCAAYPNFRWQRLFHGEQFKGLLYSENLADSTIYEPQTTDSLYHVIQARTLHGELQRGYEIRLVPGDEVVVSRPDKNEVLSLARRLEAVRPGLHAQTIFYHLDHQNLHNLNTSTYEDIFNLP